MQNVLAIDSSISSSSTEQDSKDCGHISHLNVYLRCDPHFKSSRHDRRQSKREEKGKKNLCFLFSSRNVIDRNVHTHTNKSVNPKNYNNNKGEETEIHQSTKHTHARAQIQLVHRCELIHQSMKANYNVSKWKCPFSFPPCLSLYYCFFFQFFNFCFCLV